MNRLIDILGGETKMTIEAAADSKAWTYNVLPPADRRHPRYVFAGDVSRPPFGGSPAQRLADVMR